MAKRKGPLRSEDRGYLWPGGGLRISPRVRFRNGAGSGGVLPVPIRTMAYFRFTKSSVVWQMPTHMAEYGRVLREPDKEAAWYDRLPKPLQEYLTSLGTTKETLLPDYIADWS
ncbi:hypothetical protein ACVWWO_000366 [Bradyrhizobium sp. F1.13.1]